MPFATGAVTRMVFGRSGDKVQLAADVGVSVGLALWTAALSIASALLMVVLTYRPRLVVPLALGAPMTMLCLMLWR